MSLSNVYHVVQDPLLSVYPVQDPTVGFQSVLSNYMLSGCEGANIHIICKRNSFSKCLSLLLVHGM